jgi:transmembrane sensor
VSEKKMTALAESATDIEVDAARWLERRVCENWTHEDEVALDLWLAESPARMVAYLRLSAAWGRTDRLAVLRARPPTGSVRFNKPRRAISGVLGVVAATMALAATVFAFSGSREQVYETGLGKHQTIRLSDGSRIELNTGTLLRLDQSETRRTAWLDKGEAYFEIVHNAERPFLVVADGRRVTDLGTKFVVRRETSHVEVALMEGRARLDAPARVGKQQTMLLVPGDVAVSAADSLAVTRESARALANELGWRRGILVFDNATLADAAFQFNRYNSTKLIVSDPSVARLAIYGTFSTGDFERFARVAQDVFGLRVTHLGDQTVISR